MTRKDVRANFPAFQFDTQMQGARWLKAGGYLGHGADLIATLNPEIEASNLHALVLKNAHATLENVQVARDLLEQARQNSSELPMQDSEYFKGAMRLLNEILAPWESAEGEDTP